MRVFPAMGKAIQTGHVWMWLHETYTLTSDIKIDQEIRLGRLRQPQDTEMVVPSSVSQ